MSSHSWKPERRWCALRIYMYTNVAFSASQRAAGKRRPYGHAPGGVRRALGAPRSAHVGAGARRVNGTTVGALSAGLRARRGERMKHCVLWRARLGRATPSKRQRRLLCRQKQALFICRLASAIATVSQVTTGGRRRGSNECVAP